MGKLKERSLIKMPIESTIDKQILSRIVEKKEKKFKLLTAGEDVIIKGIRSKWNN